MPNSRAALFLGALAALAGSACDFKLPKPPPDIFYKFNVLKTGAGPSYLLSTDLNLDGKIDLVSVNTQGHSITLFYGEGDGTFRKPVHLKVQPEPSAAAAGDLNNDGIPDLAINSRGGDSLTLLFGGKTGSFNRLRKRQTGRVPLAVILGDFNNDNRLDAVVTLTFNKMEVYLGLGDGRFKKGATYPTGSRSFSGVSVDFDGDGNKDIALAVSSSNASSIRIFSGNGDGTFRQTGKIAEGMAPLALIKKDMNGDGREDLIAASGKGDNLHMFYSNRDGTFQPAVTFSAGGGPMALVADDFDGDEWPDVAVANSRGSNFSVAFRRVGGGGFRFPTRDYVVAGGAPLAIAGGDFNGDGKADIAVASSLANTVEIYLRRRAPAGR